MKSFLLHIDSLNVLDELGDTEAERYMNAGKLLFAIREYQRGNEPEMDTITRVAFSSFRNQFEREREKYESIVERNRANGKRGGRPKKLDKTEVNPKEPKVTQKTQPVIPAFEEFREYAVQNSPRVDITQLEWKYKSWVENDWKDGNNRKIKNWKTKLLNTLKYLESNGKKTASSYNRGNAIQQTKALFGDHK